METTIAAGSALRTSSNAITAPFAPTRCAEPIPPRQDVISETCLIAWRRLDALPDAPLPWLYETARRLLANQRRAAGHQQSVADRLAAEPVAAGHDLADAVAGSSARRATLA